MNRMINRFAVKSNTPCLASPTNRQHTLDGQLRWNVAVEQVLNIAFGDISLEVCVERCRTFAIGSS